MGNFKVGAVIIVCLIVLCLFIYGVGRSAWSWYLLRTKKGVNLTCGFGEQSLAGLLTLYSGSLSLDVFVLKTSDVLGEYEFSLILASGVILTYLFFGNDWFRNSVAMNVLNRIKRN